MNDAPGGLLGPGELDQVAPAHNGGSLEILGIGPMQLGCKDQVPVGQTRRDLRQPGTEGTRRWICDPRQSVSGGHHRGQLRAFIPELPLEVEESSGGNDTVPRGPLTILVLCGRDRFAGP